MMRFKCRFFPPSLFSDFWSTAPAGHVFLSAPASLAVCRRKTFFVLFSFLDESQKINMRVTLSVGSKEDYSVLLLPLLLLLPSSSTPCPKIMANFLLRLPYLLHRARIVLCGRITYFEKEAATTKLWRQSWNL